MHVPQWGFTNTRCHRIKFQRHSNMTTLICAPLVQETSTTVRTPTTIRQCHCHCVNVTVNITVTVSVSLSISLLLCKCRCYCHCVTVTACIEARWYTEVPYRRMKAALPCVTFTYSNAVSSIRKQHRRKGCCRQTFKHPLLPLVNFPCFLLISVTQK
jgi:hypothetical protein